MSTTYHVCLDIDGTLKRHGNRLKGILSADGKDMTGKEVKSFLRKVRDEKGFKFYSGCDNMNSEGRCVVHPSSSPDL
jgi:hypothetical protein